MSFYQQIAPYYHHIFKTNAAQVNFVTSKIPDSESSIVDVGCGIGTLSFELIKHFNNVFGIDMDAEMIQVAVNGKGDNYPDFKQLSMLDLTTHFNKDSMDGIICFGNTLVHLDSLDEITDFLIQAKTVLKPNGKLLIQIVNYDRILSKSVKYLPLIENDEILFERNYEFQKLENKIGFNTRLKVKSTNEIIENSIKLVPILKNELTLLLNNAGFESCNFYGDFKKDDYSIDSPALIIEAW